MAKTGHLTTHQGKHQQINYGKNVRKLPESKDIIRGPVSALVGAAH
jgi:hypothetical protein